MNETANLSLPYILASQAQKHVTHNEAIRALDCLVQLSVENRVLTGPPGSPADGSRYVVAAGASGAWAGESDKIAAFQDGGWSFYAPKDGWIAWVASENILIVYDSATWSPVTTGGGGGGGGVTDHGMLTGLADDDHLQYLTEGRGDARYTPIDPVTLGVNSAADTTNRLAVSSPASLFNHDGNGHQVKINKNSGSDTASFLFQDGFSGRAEIGLTGDDDFHFKVSPDGSAWFDSIRIDRTTGKVSFPAAGAARELLTANRTYYVRTDGSDSNDGVTNTSGGAFLTIQKAIDTAATLDISIYNVTISIADGTYTIISPILGKSAVGAGEIWLVGNETTPANVVITSSTALGSAAGLLAFPSLKTTYRVRGVTLQSTATNHGIYVDGTSVIWIRKIVLGSGLSDQLRVSLGGSINIEGDYSITGGAVRHFIANTFGNINAVTNSLTITLVGTPAFSSSFVAVTTIGAIQCSSGLVTFSGSATGVRYSVTLNGVINSFSGGNVNYFPGNSVGSTATGGQYA
jgi:hypothetical protein